MDATPPLKLTPRTNSVLCCMLTTSYSRRNSPHKTPHCPVRCAPETGVVMSDHIPNEAGMIYLPAAAPSTNQRAHQRSSTIRIRTRFRGSCLKVFARSFTSPATALVDVPIVKKLASVSLVAVASLRRTCGQTGRHAGKGHISVGNEANRRGGGWGALVWEGGRGYQKTKMEPASSGCCHAYVNIHAENSLLSTVCILIPRWRSRLQPARFTADRLQYGHESTPHQHVYAGRKSKLQRQTRSELSLRINRAFLFPPQSRRAVDMMKFGGAGLYREQKTQI